MWLLMGLVLMSLGLIQGFLRSKKSIFCIKIQSKIIKQVYSWCCRKQGSAGHLGSHNKYQDDKINKIRSILFRGHLASHNKNQGDKINKIGTSFIVNCNWKPITKLFHAVCQYFQPKECEVSQSSEEGLLSLKVLQVTSETKCPLSLGIECPLLHNNIVLSTCDHNGGVMATEDGIKLTICKNAIKKGDLVTFCVAVGLQGPFVFPSDCEVDLNLSSPYYWIGVTKSYPFQKPILVEFEHFGACDPSHYQLLCCEDNDESYTMKPVDYELNFTLRDDMSLCRFMSCHFCSFCLYHNHRDTNTHRIAALYLKPSHHKPLNNFSVEIWFSLEFNHCLNRNKKIYEQKGMKLENSYRFTAPSNKKSKHCFILGYEKEVNGWHIAHTRSTEIETKDVNFYNYYQSGASLEVSENFMLFPPRFLLHIRNPECICNTDLDTHIIIQLYKDKKHKHLMNSITFKLDMPSDTSSNKVECSITSLIHSCCDNKPTFRDLLKYSKNISCKWKCVAIHLGIDEAQVAIFDCDNPSNVEGKCYDMLNYWVQNNPSACWCHFIKALSTVDLHDVAEDAKKHVIKAVDLDMLIRCLGFVSEDSLRLIADVLQCNTVHLNSGSKEEKIKRISKAYLGRENSSWTDLCSVLKEAKCDDAATFIKATFLPNFSS